MHLHNYKLIIVIIHTRFTNSAFVLFFVVVDGMCTLFSRIMLNYLTLHEKSS